MATPLQSSPPAPVHKEDGASQPVYGVLNTTQTDSEALSVGKSQQPAGHPVGTAITPVEATGALQEPSEAKPEAQSGEKRDLDSTTTPAAPEKVTEDKDKPSPEKPEEPNAKKQKVRAEPAEQPSQVTTGPASAEAATAPTSESPKKSARSKKEKVKEALAKIPSEGIGSRTRSRTKAT